MTPGGGVDIPGRFFRHTRVSGSFLLRSGPRTPWGTRHFARCLHVLGFVIVSLVGAVHANAQQDEADRLYAKGVEARHEGRNDDAVRLLRAAAAIQPDNADVLVQLGLALMGAGDLDAAEASLQRVLELAPSYSDARIGLARIAFRRGRLDKAQETLAPVLSSEPGHADARALSAQIASARREQVERQEADQRRERERQAAEREARRRAELERLSREARTLRIRGKVTESIARYSRALELSPGNVDLLVGLGLAQGFAGDHEAARRTFRRVLERNPTSADARLGLARVALWTGSPDEAEALVIAVLADEPRNLDALMLQARLQLARGKSHEAEEIYSKVLATDPHNVDALLGLGDARRTLWNERGARDAYERALRFDPASTEARSRLAERPEPRWQVDIDGLRSNLSDGFKPWNEGAFRLGYRVSPSTTVSAAAELSERFGEFDASFEGRIDHLFTPTLAGYVLLGGTPDADFRPKYQIGAGGSARLSPGVDSLLGPTIAAIDLRYAEYETGGIQTVSPGLEQRFLGERLWLTGRWINTFDPDRGRTGGWLVRADVQVVNRLRIFAGLSDAPDISEGLVLETFSTFGGLVLDLDENISLRASVGREDRDKAYDRTVFGIGMSVRF